MDETVLPETVINSYDMRKTIDLTRTNNFNTISRYPNPFIGCLHFNSESILVVKLFETSLSP